MWSHRNVSNAIADMRTMLQMQQPDGRIPEIIFWGPQVGFLTAHWTVFSPCGDRITVELRPRMHVSSRSHGLADCVPWMVDSRLLICVQVILSLC